MSPLSAARRSCHCSCWATASLLIVTASCCPSSMTPPPQHLPRALLYPGAFRVKKSRGGWRCASLAAATKAAAAKSKAKRLTASDEAENVLGQRTWQGKQAQGTVLLDRAFMGAYAGYAEEGSRLPSDLLAIRQGVSKLVSLHLPAYFIVVIVLCKYAPAIDDMVELMSRSNRPGPNSAKDKTAAFLVQCAAQVRSKHQARMRKKDKTTAAWNKHYSAAYGLMGPMACGAPGSGMQDTKQQMILHV